MDGGLSRDNLEAINIYKVMVRYGLNIKFYFIIVFLLHFLAFGFVFTLGLCIIRSLFILFWCSFIWMVLDYFNRLEILILTRNQFWFAK